MPANLTTLLDAIQTRIVAAVSGTTFGFGQATISRHGKPPRVVWVPVGSPAYEGPRHKRPLVRRSLATRIQLIAAHCWADDLAGLETLKDAVHRAVHREAYGAALVLGEEWPAPGNVDRGLLCVVSYRFQIPIEAPAYTTQTITTIDADPTPDASGDNILVWEE